MLTEILTQYVGKKELVEFHCNKNNTTKFHIGYVIACNNDQFVSLLISPEGYFDGYMLEDIDDIIFLQSSGKYEKKIETLIKYQKTKINFIELENENLVYSSLEYAMNTGSLISIEAVDSDYWDGIGFIEMLDHEVCKIKQVDDYGLNDGERYFRLEDITKATFNGQHETIFEILHTDAYRQE